ncbi:MAG: EthD family reductase [Clostridiales bacterium]|nr:EthD family reductase [Clostridiales bacterium]
MVKLIALFKEPEDRAKFQELYEKTHLPLARKMPGLRRLEISRVVGMPGGGKSPYLQMAELYFDSLPELEAAMNSPEGKEAARNLFSFAKDVVSMHIAEVESEDFHG